MAPRLRAALLCLVLSGTGAAQGPAPEAATFGGGAPPSASTPHSTAPLEAAAAAAAREGRWPEVLASLVKLQGIDPQRYVDGRFDYLAARALERLSRVDEALPRFERYIDAGDLFDVPARLSAARLRFSRGDAALALRHLMPLLQRRRGAVAQRALRTGLDALEARMDADALEQLLVAEPFAPSRERRRLLALKADALDARGRAGEAASLRLTILAGGKRDDAAALVLVRELRPPGSAMVAAPDTLPDAELHALAETARAQRDLPLAQRLVEERVRRAEARGGAAEVTGARFDLARLLAGRGKFAEARALFEGILDGQRPPPSVAPAARRPARTRTPPASDPAPGTPAFFGRVRFNLGATLEKLGLLDEAAREFARLEAEGSGPVGLALLSRARLEARRGSFDLSERLLALPRLAREKGLVECLLLLAARRAEDGDGAGAARVLSRVEAMASARRLEEPWRSELPFWRGRVLEARGDLRGALAMYSSLLSSRPYSAIGLAARARIERMPQVEVVKPYLRDLRESGGKLLASSPGRAVALLLPPALLGDEAARDLLSLAYQELPRHALVLHAPDFPDDRLPALCGDAAACRLLQLGLPQDAEPIVRDARHLDSLTGCLLAVRLAEDAEAGPPALEAAEALARHVPADFLLELAPRSVRRALAPRPFERYVAEASQASGVPADLLYAVMRQESRFDREAASPAAARGLMQLTLPAAGEAARELNEPPPAYLDLYDPARSIRLGSRTLRGLLDRFSGDTAAVASGYNAGAGQTALWLAGSAAPGEALLAAISYTETRTYVRRVLANRALYRLSAAGGGAPPPAPPGARGVGSSVAAAGR